MSRIDNLGDYGTIWKDLAMYNGSKDALFKSIRDSTVKQVTSGIVAKTLLVAVPTCVTLGASALKLFQIKRASKIAKQKEPELRAQLEECD